MGSLGASGAITALISVSPWSALDTSDSVVNMVNSSK